MVKMVISGRKFGCGRGKVGKSKTLIAIFSLFDPQGIAASTVGL
jgi:hypothetical protein